MKKHFSGLAFLVMLTLLSGNIFTEENKSPEQELASTLLSAHSEEERSKLLDSNKSYLTVVLRKALIDKGQEFNLKSDFPSALTAFELAKLVSEKIGDDIGIGHALRGIGTVHILKGDNKLALDYFQQSLVIAQKSGEIFRIRFSEKHWKCGAWHWEFRSCAAVLRKEFAYSPRSRRQSSDWVRAKQHWFRQHGTR